VSDVVEAGVNGNPLRGRPLAEVLRRLSDDVSLLVRQEIELAKAELAEKARTAATGIGFFAGAAAVAVCAAGASTAFLVLALALVLPGWAAALIVALALVGLAVVLVLFGRQRLARAGKPVPEQTIETVKEDVEWAKTRAASARR
jgi:uncharacterized membrane protein (UPF0136 family)